VGCHLFSDYLLAFTRCQFTLYRLRQDESDDEKWKYIKINPVRAGLIDDAEAWPYVYEPDRYNDAPIPE
jgi:hypothetical protein